MTVLDPVVESALTAPFQYGLCRFVVTTQGSALISDGGTEPYDSQQPTYQTGELASIFVDDITFADCSAAPEMNRTCSRSGGCLHRPLDCSDPWWRAGLHWRAHLRLVARWTRFAAPHLSVADLPAAR
jgi:hypothetical protein